MYKTTQDHKDIQILQNKIVSMKKTKCSSPATKSDNYKIYAPLALVKNNNPH